MGILDKWHKPYLFTFISPSNEGSTLNVASIGLAVYKEKKFENVESEWPWRRPMNDLDLWYS